MTTGFYWVKHWRTGPWSIVFVYADGSWSSVWWADPAVGRVEALVEIGPRVKPPNGEDHERPAGPLGELQTLQNEAFQLETKLDQQWRKFDEQLLREIKERIAQLEAEGK